MKGYFLIILMSTAGTFLAMDSENVVELPKDFTIPYMVYLQSSPEPCVGSLIHPEWVLTAAHCPVPAKIRLGVNQPTIKNFKEQIRNYSMIVPHPNFDPQSLNNNLMMIKLSKAVTLNFHVGTIAIAFEPNLLNVSCFISTWIWNEYKNQSDADNMAWINQYPLSFYDCQNLVTQGQAEYTMCVGQPLNILFGNKKEVSAAPAVCNGRLHGILSWAKGSVTMGSEGFFINLHPYARWIMEIMNTH